MPKALVLVGSGVGDIIQSTPLIDILAKEGFEIDVSAWSTMPDAYRTLQGWDVIKNLYFTHIPVGQDYKLIDLYFCSPRNVFEIHKWLRATYYRLFVEARLCIDLPEDVDVSRYDLIVPSLQGALAFYSNRVLYHPRLVKFRFSWIGRDLNRSEADRNLDILKKLRIDKPTTYSTHCEYDRGIKFDSYDFGIALDCNPNRCWDRKRWHFFQELTEKLYPKRVAILGLPPKTSEKKWSENCTDFRGRRSLGQTATLLRQCKAFITIDNGLAHMSGALGTKTFVIFGATNPNRTKILGNTVVITKNLSCSPCYLTKRWKNCHDWQCMSELTADDVIRVIRSESTS